MELIFQTKEESNKIQEDEFLQLSGIERIYSFLELSYQLRNLPTKNTPNATNNFEIIINCG